MKGIKKVGKMEKMAVVAVTAVTAVTAAVAVGRTLLSHMFPHTDGQTRALEMAATTATLAVAMAGAAPEIPSRIESRIRRRFLLVCV